MSYTTKGQKKMWSKERIKRGYWMISYRYQKLTQRTTALNEKQKELTTPLYKEVERLKKLFNSTTDLYNKNRQLFYETTKTKQQRKEFLTKQKEILEILKHLHHSIQEKKAKISEVLNENK